MTKIKSVVIVPAMAVMTLLSGSAAGMSAPVITLPDPVVIAAPDGYEPPVNTWLADSAWPMSHRGSYAQGSSSLAGPESAGDLQNADFTGTNITNITLAMSPFYPDGTQVYWGSTFGNVYKLKANTSGLAKIDQMKKGGGVSLENLKTATSGAYTFVDSENNFYTVNGASVLAYGDSIPNDSTSDIELLREYTIPSNQLHGTASEDPIVGMNLTFDGMVTFATKQGTVGIVDRHFTQAHYVQLGDAAGEEVSNSISLDEDGGIYVVSAKQMYRVQWTGAELTLDEGKGGWQSSYEIGEGVSSAGRLGAGSGSTPSLMGTGDMDKFVVITDGQELAHIVLFWRDEIPTDWQPIAEGKSRRIAAEIPITYGNANRTDSMSEQSVLVRGYGAVVVSNDYRNIELISGLSTGNSILDTIRNGIVVFFSNLQFLQPYGVEKFEWNPAKRTLDTAWVNNDISCPNGIPTMSSASQLMYCVGARSRAWTIEGIKWDTGESKFHKRIGVLPKFNSFYAATQLGNDGTIISGTSRGVMELDPR